MVTDPVESRTRERPTGAWEAMPELPIPDAQRASECDVRYRPGRAVKGAAEARVRTLRTPWSGIRERAPDSDSRNRPVCIREAPFLAHRDESDAVSDSRAR